MVRVVEAADGQSGAAGALLFEVARLNPVWIRVPVYVGDADRIDRTASAVINADRVSGSGGRPARPVAAPPSADPVAASVDLFFELPNADEALRPGERVDASLALVTEDSSLVVPWSAVVYDIQGGAWIYKRIAEQTYARRLIIPISTRPRRAMPGGPASTG